MKNLQLTQIRKFIIKNCKFENLNMNFVSGVTFIGKLF